MPKTALIAVMRNESRYVSEWIAFHVAIGFDAVILFDNGSTDDSVARALALRGVADIRVHGWGDISCDYQKRAYLRAARLYEGEFAWMAFFDLDEFLVLEGSGLKPWLARHAQAAAIGVPWAMFGSSGHREQPEGLVIENFLRRGKADFGPNRHIKTIARPERIIDFEHIHMPNVDGVYVDPAGRRVEVERPGLLQAAPDFSGGRLHHYFTRSWAEWLLKVERGYRDLTRPVDAFERNDMNDVFDDAALGMAAAVRGILRQAGM
jgi:hypothetical protein